MQQTKKGILLVTSLIMVAIMAMFITVIVGDLKIGMFFSGNYVQQERAYWGALAGLEYAKHMVLLNWRWMGNSTAIPIDSADIFVEEGYMVGGSKQNRAVHGTINGKECEFYIAFADPALKMGEKITPVKDLQGEYLTYYSYNKISSLYSSEVTIDISGKTRSLPPRSIYVVVEGRSEKSKCFVEAIYTIDYSPSLPSTAISSGEMNIKMQNSSSKLLFTHSAGDNPNIRSNDSIIVSDGSNAKKIIDLSAGKAVARNKIEINDMEVNKNNQNEFGINAELDVDSKKAFPRLSWEEVMEKYGDPDSSSSPYVAKMKAGVYAFLEDPNAKGKYNLRYFQANYDKDFNPNSTKSFPYADYVRGINVPNNGSNLGASQLQITTDKRTAVEKVSIDIYNTVDSMAVVSYDWVKDENNKDGAYVISSTARSKFILQKNSDITQPTTLCSNGSILIRGELSGTGSVITGKSLNFEPSSQLVPSPEIGLAIYTKGNINIHNISAIDNCPNPNSYMNSAIQKYISIYGENYTSIYTTSYRILNTYIQTTAGLFTLNDLLGSKFGYSPWESFDLVIKSLMKNSERKGNNYKLIAPNEPGYSELSPSDSVIKGVIYTWQDFNTSLYGGSLTIRGAVVAYGGNPATQDPGAYKDSGKVSIENGQLVNIIYDPNYLGFLGIEGLDMRIKQVMFNRM